MATARRVLIVEDEPSENEFLALTARGLGFAADCAFDGQAALEMAATSKPDLVLLDALLPKLDGFAVLTELRQRHPDLPVVMMSGIYKKRSYEAEALRMGASAYLVKPLSVVAIWELLDHHLGRGESGLPSDFPGVPFWRRPLPAVVADLHLAAKTGLLFVRAGTSAAILFFENGNIVFARCNDLSTRLDNVLVSSGRIPATTLPRINELMAASRGMRLGELLVQEGIVTAEVVHEALVDQQRVQLTRPFGWTDGACHFFPTDAPRRETFKMPVDVPALVFWGCRTIPMDEHLINWLPRTERTPRLTQPAGAFAPRLGLSASEAQFAELIDGTRSIGALRSIARLLQVDGEHVLAGMHALHLIDVPRGDESSSMAATGMSGAAVPAAGDIARFKPPLLFVTVALSRKSGMAQLESTDPAGQTRTIWFEHGAIAFASSNDPQDRLGQVLLREEPLTKEQLQQALATAQEKPGTALGRILVDLGVITPDGLHRALVLQVQRVITGLLGWRKGTFQFQERGLPVKEIVPLGLDTRGVLLNAFRTCAFADIMGQLPPPETLLRRTVPCHELASNLPLTALEDRVLLEVDGQLSVQGLAGREREGAEPLLRAVHALMSMGLVEGLLPTPGVARPAAPAPVAVATPRLDTAADAAPVRAFTFEEPPEPARTDAAPVEGGHASAPGAQNDWAAAWTPEPRGAGLPLDGGFDDEGGTLATPQVAAATAVLEAPAAASSPAVPAHLAELARFFTLLAAWLEASPGTVPESVLAALPADLRALFRL